LSDLSIDSAASQGIALGIFLALVIGKPVGILLACWTVVRVGLCRLPRDVNWRGIAVVGCLGGIGFTMSIFIATLAFDDDALLGAAKLGVLAGSAVAGLWGLMLGRLFVGSRAALNSETHVRVPSGPTPPDRGG
jgi:NhaA family Na+:H+ antiporter